MNIVIVNDFAYVEGGASKVALGSALALAARGHRVILFAAVGPVDTQLTQTPGIEVHCLNQHDILTDPRPQRAAVRGLWNFDAARAFEHVLAGLSAGDTVVHLHTWTKAHSASVMHAATKHMFPTVMTLHDYFAVCPNGGLFLYPEKQLCHLRPMSTACIATQCDSRSYSHKLWRVARQWLQQNVGGVPSEITRFISISDTSERLLRPYLPSNAQIQRVSNPIQIAQEPPMDAAQNDRFCFVGRLSPEKGPALLAQQRGMKMVFVGDGPERALLEATAPDAEFTGWVIGEKVREVMRSSRALVFPSLWYETQGLTVLEAAAIGLPAVVPSGSAAREWVEDGVTGMVFQHANANDLGEKLRWLHNNPRQAARMGCAAYDRYWERPCTMNTHCDGLEGIYRDALRQHAESNV